MEVHTDKNNPRGHLVPKRRCINVDAASSRRIDVDTSFLSHVPAEILQYIMQSFNIYSCFYYNKNIMLLP